MFKGELTGSDGYTDRKQSLSLSSYRSWVKPRGGDQRSAPCVQLTDTLRSIPFAGCATPRFPVSSGWKLFLCYRRGTIQISQRFSSSFKDEAKCSRRLGADRCSGWLRFDRLSSLTSKTPRCCSHHATAPGPISSGNMPS